MVEPGHARRLAEILGDPRLSPGAAVLLRAASQRQVKSGSEPAGVNDSDQQRYHERLAEDGLAFMQAEPGYLDLTLALSTALSAEACDREDIFAGAIRHLTTQPIGLHGRMFRLQKPRRFCRSVRPRPIKAVA
ncbi:hypothetical protein D3C73_528820 [compost metagenome]